MSRKIRYVPERGTLIEVTSRTIQGRYLLRPSQQLNDIFLGVLGRAQRLYPLEICGFVCLSTHYHLLVVAETARQLAEFMCYFNSNLAREVCRLHNWSAKLWDGRYKTAHVTNEEFAQVGRLSYLLSNSCKEWMVESPLQWPGVHCAVPLLAGETTVQGTWYSRTEEYCARLRGETFEPGRFATAETVTLSPLPCWAALSPEAYRRQVTDLVREAEREAAQARKEANATVLGVEAILAQDPHARPEELDESPAPLVHAATKAARKAFWEAYNLFVTAFREASERLRSGDLTAVFPVGSFPPALPFVGG